MTAAAPVLPDRVGVRVERAAYGTIPQGGIPLAPLFAGSLWAAQGRVFQDPGVGVGFEFAAAGARSTFTVRAAAGTRLGDMWRLVALQPAAAVIRDGAGRRWAAVAVDLDRPVRGYAMVTVEAPTAGAS